MMRLAIGLCCGGILFGAATARAQSAEAYGDSAAYGAHVSIGAGNRAASLQIVPEGSASPVAECDNYCDFWALPGRYTLYTRDHGSGAAHTLRFRIKRSARYTLQEGDESARDVGLTVGIGGAVAIFSGLLMTMPVVLASMCEDSNCVSDSDRTWAKVGLGFMAAGAIATPIGFSVFSHNRTLLRPLAEPAYAEHDAGTSVRVGIIGVSGGLGLGGVALF